MTVTVTEEVQKQVLGAVRKSQEISLDAARKVVEAVSAAQAKLPAARAKLPAAPRHLKLPELPAKASAKASVKTLADKLPQLSDLPKPEAVVSSAHDFFGQLLADQRKFATELIAAASALRPAKAEASGEKDSEGGE
jgi:hypothetical protein